MSGFSNRQLKKLIHYPDPDQILNRNRDGKVLSYIPGWLAISEANEIFGHAGWDRHTLHLDKLFERRSMEGTECGYTARVRIVVRADETTITRDGTGFGRATARLPCDAHERALKSAETDATKRALATFGNRFGLMLYQGKAPNAELTSHMRQASSRFVLRTPDGAIFATDLSPEAFAGGLRQLIEKSGSVEAIEALISKNAEALAGVKQGFPDLTARTGRHYSDVLEELANNRKSVLVERQGPQAQPAMGRLGPGKEKSPSECGTSSPQFVEKVTKDEIAVSENSDQHQSNLQHIELPRPSRISHGPSIDKSILAYALERRIRNKRHLAYVAGQPCVLCAEAPCHAHHITYAQPRGFAVKVSDEFTVPLCVLHHNQVHQTKPEKAWWKEQGIDPLPLAARLWEETLRQAVKLAGNNSL